MAKLLTEEEYNALLADRERLEWVGQYRNEWLPGAYGGGILAWSDTPSGHTPIWNSIGAPTMREAIDKARGVVK